jgi:hypothetical protein
MSDKLVFDMAMAGSATPSVFIKKDYFKVTDDQNGIYTGNQSVIQTSATANSGRYMDFKNSYITIPLVLSLTADGVGTAFTPLTDNNNFAIGLKNWFGSVIHSCQVDYNNTTAQQLTSYQSMFNAFKLHTTLSVDDVATQGASIGYAKDTSTSWGRTTATGLENNRNILRDSFASIRGNNMALGNAGFYERQKAICFDPLATTDTDNAAGLAYSTLCSATNAQNLYRSHVYRKVDGAGAVVGSLQIAVMANVMSKHLSDFLAKLPLSKSSFVKITMNLNQTSHTLVSTGALFNSEVVNSPLGGVSPLMVAGVTDGLGAVLGADTYIASVGVGRNAPSSANHPAGSVVAAPLASSIEMSIPAYEMSPIFEAAYLAKSVVRFEYEDIYNYNIINRAGGSRITELLSNGISNQSRLVICPFLNASSNGTSAVSPFQSCLTTDGSTTSPLAINNFNVQLSGQNVLMQNSDYSYSAFLEQLKGTGAVNGGNVDGITSGLISQLDFENNYAYYVVDTSRMPDIEKSVAKSVQIMANIQTPTGINVDLYCFIARKVSFAIDLLTGSRV